MTSPSGSTSKLEITTLGGGCFWCLEAVYVDLRGVEKVVSGYAGGQVANPSYRQVCAGTTGHAEVVQVHFDPQVISFREISAGLLHHPRPHHPQPPGRRRGDPVPVGHFLPR